MHKVLRFTALAILAASGLTACGDKVTNVTNSTSTTSTTTATPVVHSVTVTPNAVSLNAGQSVQLVATVDADAGVARTVTWTTSASSVATVDNTGKVTAVAAGTAVIIATSTADAGKQGTAAITVAGTTNPSVTISQINQGGFPAVLNNVAGQLDVTLNVDPGSTFIKTINLFLNCGAGDVLVASQTVSDKAPMTGPAGASQPVTLSFNTADTTAAGVPKFKNGACTVKGQLITTTGSTFNSANSVQITLNNLSTYTATISTTPSHGVSSAISTLDGLQRMQGALALTIKALNYNSGVGLQTITGTFMGRTFTANASAGQVFTVSFPLDTSKSPAPALVGGVAVNGPAGWCQTAPACLGVSEYATTTVVGGTVQEAAPVITASIDSTGNNGFTAAAKLPAPFRLDNQAPAQPVSDTILANTGSNYWVNGSYTLSGTHKYTSGGDAVMGSVTDSIGYAAPTGYAAIANPTAVKTAVGDAYCSKAGFTIVSSMSQIPTSTTNATYRARVFEYDPFGNVRCTDLVVDVNGGAQPEVSAFGVDKSPPQVAFCTAAGAPYNNCLGASVAANAKMAAAAGNWAVAVNDTGSGFNPTLPILAKVTFNYLADSAHCPVGWKSSSQTCTQIPLASSTPVNNVAAASGSATAFSAASQGYWMITTHSIDQAGNTSPDSMRTVLIDGTAPTLGSISQSPSSIAALGSGTFTAAATDNVDLGSWGGTLNYAPASGAVNFAETGGTFNAGFNGTLVQSGTASVTIANIFRGMQGTAAGLVAADAAAPAVSMSDKDVEGNSTAVGPTAITMASGVNNVLQACSGAAAPPVAPACGFNVSTSSATVSKGAATPTSVTLTANITGTTTGIPNQPFATVYFFYQNASGNLVLIGSQSLGAVTDDAASNRTWTFTLSGVNAASLGSPASGTPVTVMAVGVTAAGDAVVTNANAITVTVNN